MCRAIPRLRRQAGLPQCGLIEADGIGEPLVDPGVDDADTIGDELDLSGPRLEINVMTQIIDLLLRALDEDESTQLRALRLEDRGIESLDPSVAREAVEVSGRRLLQEVESLRFTSPRGMALLYTRYRRSSA